MKRRIERAALTVLDLPSHEREADPARMDAHFRSFA
jgi:hypothetical protein